MVRRYHRSIYDELDELKASMDYLFQLALQPAETQQVPDGKTDEIICRYPHNPDAEITVFDDEIMITVDMVPGMDPSEICVDLVDSETLKISCDQKRSISQGQHSFSLHHLISLPAQVTRHGARSTLKNGVLDLRLKTITP